MAISTPDTWGGATSPMPPTGDGDRLTLAVVDPDPRLRTRLALQLGEDGDVVTYPEVAALAEYQSGARPLVVVFGPGLADGPGLAGGRGDPRRHRAVDQPVAAGAAVGRARRSRGADRGHVAGRVRRAGGPH